jgi:cation transport regulator ChaB
MGLTGVSMDETNDAGWSRSRREWDRLIERAAADNSPDQTDAAAFIAAFETLRERVQARTADPSEVVYAHDLFASVSPDFAKALRADARALLPPVLRDLYRQAHSSAPEERAIGRDTLALYGYDPDTMDDPRTLTDSDIDAMVDARKNGSRKS